jgi:predicted transcriptional regulator
VVDQELEAVLAAARAKSEGLKQPIAKVNYSHTAMIDLIIAQPGVSQNEIARYFGYTPAWISQVISSDAFQSALAKRREEIVDPLMRETVETQFKALVSRSLDILQQKLNRPALEIPDNLALRTLEIASRAAGYGAKDDSPPQNNTPVEVNIHLEQLGGGLVALLQRKRLEAQVIDVQPARGANPGPQSESESAASSVSVAAQQIAQLTNESPED